MPLAIIALTIATFGIGTSEFVIMGLLPEVAHDLGVSIPKNRNVGISLCYGRGHWCSTVGHCNSTSAA
ncbi:putative membrane transport protein [Yersinia enterocolitica]|nr:putative membrane transport protein [Yersinia enterocolitica]